MRAARTPPPTGCPAGPATNRLVHFAPHESDPRPGDVVTVTVTRGAPHYLLSDSEPLSLRRTRAGDAWAAATAAPEPAAQQAAAPVLLGMPAPSHSVS